MSEKLLNLKEASEILKISEDEIKSLVENGRIPAYKIAGVYLRFKKEQVETLKDDISYKKPKKTQTFQRKDEGYISNERLKEFLYFNDFYIICVVIILIALVIIFKF